MKSFLTTLIAVTLLGWGAAGAWAQGPASPGDAPTAKPQTADSGPTIAELRVKIHRTMAALIQEQSAEKPDPRKIDQLTGKLQRLRQQLWSTAPAGQRGWRCPMGGPGMGPGPAWNGRGQGQGYGPGPAYGRGMGQGRGRGPGYGPGRGPGYGRGMGQGRGPGYGRGAGFGPGLGFVDANNNGICDYYEQGPVAK